MTTILHDGTTEILLENIMRMMSKEFFGLKKSARIVGGEKKLKQLIEAGKIDACKGVNKQNGKWYCRADQVLMHCRNMRPRKKSTRKKTEQ